MSEPLPCGCYEGQECRGCAALLDDEAWIVHMEQMLAWDTAQYPPPGRAA